MLVQIDYAVCPPGGVTEMFSARMLIQTFPGCLISMGTSERFARGHGDLPQGCCTPAFQPSNLHRSIFMDSYLDKSILPAGYIVWSGDPNGNIGPKTLEAVYDVYGPGYYETAEVAGGAMKVLDAEQARPYGYPVDVFQTQDGKPVNVGWIDQSVLYGSRY